MTKKPFVCSPGTKPRRLNWTVPLSFDADRAPLVPPCWLLAVPNAERDSLLFYRKLTDDYIVPDWSGGHDHAKDAEEGHQHI